MLMRPERFDELAEGKKTEDTRGSKNHEPGTRIAGGPDFELKRLADHGAGKDHEEKARPKIGILLRNPPFYISQSHVPFLNPGMKKPLNLRKKHGS